MNEQLITGSTALKHWFPNQFTREPKDLDIISKIGKSSKAIEYHWVPSFQYILNANIDDKYVDPNFLYTIKISHAAWDVHWDKTMQHIGILKERGCTLDLFLYNKLLKEWEIIHGKKNIVLKGTPEEFFNKNITRKIPHDELHELVKFYNKPMHTFIRFDENDVKVDKNLWDSLKLEDKTKCALEEVYVFALERYIEYPSGVAFIKALKQLITKSTKGYFNLFLIDNFFELLYYDRTKYVQVYKQIKEKI